jgi:hypothetical protein
MAFVEDLKGVKSKCVIGEIRCDASIQEEHGRDATVTEHAVEFGSDITDHYRPEPGGIEIQGEVSDTPLGTSFPLQTAINSAQRAFMGGSPVQNAWKEFNRYFDEQVIITIETSLDTYRDMMLTSLVATRNNQSGGKLAFAATARPIKFAYTSEIDALAEIAAETASTTVDGEISDGAQTTSDASTTEATQAEQLLDSLAAQGVI